MSQILGGQNKNPKTINGVPMTQSQAGLPIPVGMGQFKIHQSLLFIGAVDEQEQSGGKGGGKGNNYYLYYAPVAAALCNGPVTGIGSVWTGQTWLSSQGTNEGISVVSNYSPQNAALLIADNGVAFANTYSATYNDYGLPASTVLSGTDYAPLTLIPWYSTTTAYAVGKQVFNGTDVYTCKKANTNEALSNTTYWTNTGSGLTTGQYSISAGSLGALTLSSVANASAGNTVYTGSSLSLSGISGASNAFAGYKFSVSGFTTAANNGTFTCTASTSTTITLNNASGVAQTHGATATDVGNVYHFSSADSGKDAIVWYQFNYSLIQQQDILIVPTSSVIGGSTVSYGVQLSNQYTPTSVISVQYYGENQENAGVALTQVSSPNPTVEGTFYFSGAQSIGGSYYTWVQFSSADLANEIMVTWGYTNQSSVGQSAPELINFVLYGGTMGQPINSFFEDGGQWQLGGGSSNVASGYMPGNPGETINYTGIAYIAYEPMFLGESGQIQDNLFEVLTPDAFGGGITDCNPVQCVLRVLTDTRWGLGKGENPFPVSAIDNSANGTWGGPAGTPGARSTNNTAWNWFAANSFFISPQIDSQESAASIMSKWMEAGQVWPYMSEGLLKMAALGSQSAAGNGCTWEAPQEAVVALDDSCFLAKEGEDPVKIPETEDYPDLYNWVKVSYSNRANQYEKDIVDEWDPASMQRWGTLTEDPQDWDFIKTNVAATFAASMRVKRNTTILDGNTYEFAAPFIYSYIEVGDIVEITTSSIWDAGVNNANLDADLLPVRITKVVDNPGEEGMQFEAEDYPALGLLPTLFNKAITAGSVNVNQWLQPGNAEVVVFQPPLSMTNQVPQVWIGACGSTAQCGSINILVSQNGTDYEQIGTITSMARLGVLVDTFNSGSDPDTVNSLVVDLAENCAPLNPGSDTDADSLNTMCLIQDNTNGNEIIAYSACTVTGDDQYTMNTYIRRGQKGTTIASHAAGKLFLRLDQSIYKWTPDPATTGTTYYLKFQSVNTYGNQAQLQSSLTPLTFTPSATNAPVDGSSGITLTTSPNTVGAGPLGWTPCQTVASFGPTINVGNYGYSGMGSTFGSGDIQSSYDWFYVRFTGYLIPATTGEYTIGLGSDDGANMYIGGQLVGSNNLGTVRAMAGNLTYSSGSSAQILLTKGVYYPIVIEWAQNTGNWGLQVMWTPPKSSTPVLIPSTAMSDNNSNVSGGLALSIWNGSPGLYYPSGNGLIDPGNTVLYGPPANGGGCPMVNTLTPCSTEITSLASGNPFPIPGWIVGQIYSSGGQFDVLLHASGNSNEGYILNFTFNGGSGSQCYPTICSSVSAYTTFAIPSLGTYAPGNTGSSSGWYNIAIYVSGTGYYAVWVNNQRVCDWTDLTYTLVSNNQEVKFGYTPGWSSSSYNYKIGPPANAPGSGSTGLNQQGSIATISNYTLYYANESPTDSTIQWSWTSFYVYCPDGNSYYCAGSTGTTLTQSGATGTLTGTGAMEWTGLSASATYYFTPYVTLNPNGTATMNIMCTGGSPPTLAQQVQIANGDGNVPCSSSICVTASTVASGGTGGGGFGGGGGTYCFSPNTKVKTKRGDVAIVELIPGQDEVLTARGTWKHVLQVTSRKWSGAMLDMGDEELSTLGHLVKDGGWKQMKELNRFPIVRYEGTIHNAHVCCDYDDDGTALDTEHSYTLANGLVVHNVQTNPNGES